MHGAADLTLAPSTAALFLAAHEVPDRGRIAGVRI